jgi:hypothetical protein
MCCGAGFLNLRYKDESNMDDEFDLEVVQYLSGT